MERKEFPILDVRPNRRAKAKTQGRVGNWNAGLGNRGEITFGLGIMQNEKLP
jgi:hypothetical protein